MALTQTQGAEKLYKLLYGDRPGPDKKPEAPAPAARKPKPRGPVNRPAIIGVTPPDILQEKCKATRAKREAAAARTTAKAPRIAHNRKPPVQIHCPCGVIFEVPPWRAQSAKYHAKECRQKYRKKPVPKHSFTEEMDAEIIALYQSTVGIRAAAKGEGPVKKLAEKFGLPSWAVSRRAAELCAVPKWKKEPNWSQKELDLLKSFAHLDYPEIQSRIVAAGCVRRSINALKIKITRGLGGKPREGYSGVSLAKLFGIDSHSVARWIDAGLLKATRRGTARTASQGGDLWRIDPEAVKEFVVNNLALIDFRKLDKWWLVELLTGRESPI